MYDSAGMLEFRQDAEARIKPPIGKQLPYGRNERILERTQLGSVFGNWIMLMWAARQDV